MFRPPREPTDPDASIRATDSDAALARLSAVQKGYLVDPFVRHLVPRAHLQPPRPPLINIGTYVRTVCIDKLVDGWLQKCSIEGRSGCQILSLGAGSDTRFWRLATGPWKDTLSKYIELDFPEITTKKTMAITKSRELSSLLGKPGEVQIDKSGTGLHSPKYHLFGVDLRLPPADTLSILLASPSTSDSTTPLLSPDVPTLLLFECVLVYMTPEASAQLVQWFVDYFSSTDNNTNRKLRVLGGIVYEMFGLNDPFGRVMVNNLKTRNVSLPGAEPYPTMQSLPKRFLQHGFRASHALSLRELRASHLGTTELERISKLEMLDEVEELELVLEHYAITWGAWIDGTGETKADWAGWGLNQAVAAQPVDSDTSE
ncbi:hypothetical protein PLEOSDRAFT_1089644 [Pleurotus ostreatus PC15]|uniref:Leucine carboxyl methyltransferase 1 n=1 Tax=Pleurotus ostreatus (strain PC15) TaxID=1137138 RepID=A0A067NMJ4_PLEO1|nr:hypothetical protein PLEOSDRAFT_1089644 [Pleurotus ostreatus PC15]